MEIKKSNKADLECRKGTWFSMGLIVVLAFMFIAFEWTEYDKKYEAAALANDPIFELTLLPVTYPEQPPAPPPPAPAVIEEIKIVEDDDDVSIVEFSGPEELGERVHIQDYIPYIECDDIVDETEIHVVVEKMPEFPGGTSALLQFLQNNLKYPAPSMDNGTQGRVIVQFVVDKDGSISDPEVVRSVDPYLDREALRVIKSMPKWNPGMQRNKAVRVKYTVPVSFKLQ